MTVREWIPWLVPVYVVGLFCLISVVISRASGWHRLTERFRAQAPFYGEAWNWQSGRFRVFCSYNRCLTVGANPQVLYVAVMFPFRIFNPALLIPWQEIEVETGKMLMGYYDTALLRLGRDEQVTLRIYGKLVNRVRQAAGPGWPLYEAERFEAQTKQ